ncbi:hypothetical protein [Segetibacter koreensis]|uniref:hypothetical protein n=1 Tax=Segetibacter koreensis TaxID=398037 RepID=UPI00036B8DB1|nr:hypothetical protein [Segetibacter koreensis]
MKRFFLLTACSAMLLTSRAQTKDVIRITGTRFPFEIVQKWIEVYRQTHPNVQFQLSKSVPADSADLIIAAHASDREN